MTKDDIFEKLEPLKNTKNIEGMARFGIRSENALGIKVPVLRQIAKDIGKNHELAAELWKSPVHEMKLIGIFIEDPRLVDEEQMEEWVSGFYSWDICDQTCSTVFDKHPLAWQKAVEWSRREEEFVKRAGFVMMAVIAVHDKKSEDALFEKFFPYLSDGAIDERNFVKKAVNWAIRSIGKRSSYLREKALELCSRILESYPDSKAAKWSVTDAVRELNDEKIVARILKKS